MERNKHNYKRLKLSRAVGIGFKLKAASNAICFMTSLNFNVFICRKTTGTLLLLYMFYEWNQPPKHFNPLVL